MVEDRVVEDAALQEEDVELQEHDAEPEGEDVAGLDVLDTRNDLMYFVVGDLGAKAFVRKEHFLVEIEYWVEKPGSSYIHYCVQIPKTLTNYIQTLLVQFQHQLKQSKKPVEQTFHF